MSNSSFNQALWFLPDYCGVLFWYPLVLFGAYGLVKMYQLAPAESALGRFIRVDLTIGFLCLIFTPIYNGLGPIAFYLLALGVCLILKQVLATCIATGKIRPATAATVIERMAERMVAR